MSVHRRLLVGVFIAFAFVCGLGAALSKSFAPRSIPSTRERPLSHDGETILAPDLAQFPPHRVQSAPDPPSEPLIEDLLRDEGENPEAIAFMTGVREAVREGNRTFAQELFEKMRERYHGSVLIEEAEALLRKE